MSRFCLLLIFILSPAILPAQELNRLQYQATQERLWEHPYWLKLLHYYPQDNSPSGFASHVDDAKFFLSAEGQQNPRAELIATLQALFENKQQDGTHAQCRFVARLAWLSETLAINTAQLPKVSCPLYDEWRQMVRSSKITLVFPAYHLNSPSSMFGHTLLRLDKGDEINDSAWLSYSVSFGADVRAEDNSILYAFKGLSGGYPGLFIVTPYFKKIQEYSRIERRDIWEYELNFTPEEVQRLVLHLWELKEIQFDYYFFDENCSYRLLELLEVARPSLDLISEFVVTAIPVDTVRAVENADLITQINYRPAEVTKLEHRLTQMSDQEKKLVLQLAEDANALDSEHFKRLSSHQQRNVIDAAYQYIRYQQRGQARNEAIAAHSHQLLKKLNQYPQAATLTPVPIPHHSPEQGHLSKRAWLGGGVENSEDYVELGFRMSFHDLEDAEAGFLRGAQINIMSLELRHLLDQDKLLINHLDFANIFSLTPRNAFFKPWSWRINLGIDRHHERTDKQTLHATGGGGVAYQVFDSNILYGLGRLRIEHSDIDDADILETAAGFETGVLAHFGSSTAHLRYYYENYAHNRKRKQLTYLHNFAISRNQALTLNYSRIENRLDEYETLGLSYRFHF